MSAIENKFFGSLP
jgi:hypothetical protein